MKTQTKKTKECKCKNAKCVVHGYEDCEHRCTHPEVKHLVEWCECPCHYEGSLLHGCQLKCLRCEGKPGDFFNDTPKEGEWEEKFIELDKSMKQTKLSIEQKTIIKSFIRNLLESQKQSLLKRVLEEIEKVQKEGHGGGNFRRLLIVLQEKIEKL